MIIDRRNILLTRKANCAHQNIRLHIFPSSQFLALQLLIECAFIWLERVLEMHDSKPSLLALDWHNIGASEKQFGVSLWDLVLAWKGVLKVLTAKHRLLAREDNTPGPRKGSAVVAPGSLLPSFSIRDAITGPGQRALRLVGPQVEKDTERCKHCIMFALIWAFLVLFWVIISSYPTTREAN